MSDQPAFSDLSFHKFLSGEKLMLSAPGTREGEIHHTRVSPGIIGGSFKSKIRPTVPAVCD